ncbi:uncharacterized protein [Diadema antillarum]|uniref:uncharacterized protein n=1 Tax=Diadema antillarum TaxID=105358 RepID=UPI003A835E76
MGSKASKHSNNLSNMPKDEVPSTAEERCCQKESVQNNAPVPAVRKSRLYVQYEEGNRHVFADFGATLLTDSEAHRLVNVDPSGLAYSIGLRENYEILDMNGVNVQDVNHDALVNTIRDIGNRVAFIVAAVKAEENIIEKGYVYFRLGAGENNIPMVEFHLKTLTIVDDKEFVIDIPLLPDGEGVTTITKYELTGSFDIELELETPTGMNLVIFQTEAKFMSQTSRLCMYKYNPSTPEQATVIAIATVSSSAQLCIDGISPAPVSVTSFPDFMKTTGSSRPSITPNDKMFRWLVDTHDQQWITSLLNQGVYLGGDSGNDMLAILSNENSFLKVNEQDDCTDRCTIKQSTDCNEATPSQN